MVTPEHLFPLYKKFMVLYGGHGLGRFRAVRAAEAMLRSLLRPRTAAVLGHKMFVDSLDTLRLSTSGTYENFQTALIHKLVHKGDCVLDIGANIGYYTLILARLVGETGRVFAFEPEPDNFRLLERNVRLNNYVNVRLERKALSNVNGMSKLYLSEINKGDHRLFDSGDGRSSVEVESVRTDDYMRNYGKNVSLIKMDVQGLEGAVLAGMEMLLELNTNVRLLTEFWPAGMVKFGTSPKSYLNTLADLGFHLYRVNEEQRRLEPTTPARILGSNDRSDDDYYTNLFATRNPEEDLLSVLV